MSARSAAACLGAVAVVLTLAAVAPQHASADITSVFNENPTPVACATQVNGVRLCDETAYQPPHDRSTVKSFDGTPIDVRVAFPAHLSGPDGPYPLIVVFHRYAGEKAPLQSLTGWIGLGYAAMSITDRGFGESCGTQAARDADPGGCAHGYVHLMDTRYEVRDAQELIGELVDDGVVDPAHIGATGNSYGGGQAVALA